MWQREADVLCVDLAATKSRDSRGRAGGATPGLTGQARHGRTSTSY